MKVLITDGETRSALAALRSLGRRGIDITVAAETKHALSFHSRYCKRSIIYPSAMTQKSLFIEFMLNTVKYREYDLLFPMSDLTILPISENLDVFSSYITVPISNQQAINKMFNKAHALKMAEVLGIPTPKTYFIENLQDVEKVSKGIEYPAVIKPRFSRIWNGDQMISGFHKYVYSPEELLREYNEMDSEIPFPLIQEFVPGKGIGVFILFNHGKPRALFSHKRIREIPVTGGVSTLCESISLDPELLRWSTRLLKEVDWHGVAMVEFKLDSRDNIPKLMEVNVRFWGSLALALHAGVDFPYLLYRMTVDGDIEPCFSYKNVKCRWLRGDLQHLIQVLTGRPKEHKIGYPNKVATFLKFLKFYERNMFYNTLTLKDPMPGIIDNTTFLFGVLSRLIRRVIR